MVYLSNAFSPGMLSSYPVTVRIEQVSESEFANVVKSENVVNAIGHQGTVDFINAKFNAKLMMNRITLKLGSGDVLYIIQLLTRLPEGKVLTSEEVANIKSVYLKITVM
ncbi:STIV orfB116 family protein [Metallosphaera sp.]|uniref:STIV orfB116 family protein n=1 Tax=Metallosphaera sp. TaxID=2020860 RepID=UPI0027A81BE7|nr:hypothetical protein [Saccharolobus shibatae filamentous virus 3]WHA35192.1 DUF1874 domain-containing protein [Saccharolobus shibatae rod virus 2]